MASGKQSRRKRAAVPTPPAARQASPRVLIAATAVVLLVAIGVTIAILVGGGSSKADATTSAPAESTPTTAAEVETLPEGPDVQTLLKGIPQKGNVLGKATAPVTVVEYVDLQCPYCQQFETQAMPDLITSYVRTGKAKVELRPIAFVGPDSQRGRAAAIAAGEQDKLFQFTQLLYLNQGTENTGWLTDDLIASAAKSIPGLNAAKLLAARDSSAVTAQSTFYDGQAQTDDVNSTPTILVGRTGGKLTAVELRSPTDGQSVAAAIDRASAG